MRKTRKLIVKRKSNYVFGFQSHKIKMFGFVLFLLFLFFCCCCFYYSVSESCFPDSGKPSKLSKDKTFLVSFNSSIINGFVWVLMHSFNFQHYITYYLCLIIIASYVSILFRFSKNNENKHKIKNNYNSFFCAQCLSTTLP